MNVTAEMVKALREKTGLPMMDCKKALAESSGDETRAIEWLREKGVMKGQQMADRVAGDGRIAVHYDRAGGRIGMAELRCETEPVSGTPEFIALANACAQLAAQSDDPQAAAVLAGKIPGGARTVQEELAEIFNRIREKMEVARVASLRGSVGYYVHHNAKVGVIVEMSAACPDEIKTDVCMHVASMSPRCARRDEVPAAEVEAQRVAAAESAQGKPPAVVEKIVAGKLDRWFGEFVLMEQPFVKDDKQSVGAMLAKVAPGLSVNRFVRFKVGGA